MLQHAIVCGVCEQLITHIAILSVVIHDVCQPCIPVYSLGRYPDYLY